MVTLDCITGPTTKGDGVTPIADMVAQMLAAGVAHEMIVLAVRTAESGIRVENRVDEAAEKRRAWDRQYRRDRKAIPPESTRIPPEQQNAPLSKEEDKKEKKKEERERRGSRLPPDWIPSDANDVFARERGLSAAEVNTEGIKFRNYWTAKTGASAKKLDWDRTWENWILNRRTNGNGAGQANGHRSRTVSEAADDLIRRAEEAEREGGSGPIIDADFERIEGG